MLVMCIADGLTVGNRVYRKGEVFPLPPVVAGEIEGMSAEAIARKQVKLYGRAFYRKATIEEMVAEYNRDKSIANHMTSGERKMIAVHKFRLKRKEEDFMADLDVDPEEIEEMATPKARTVEKVSEPESDEEVEETEEETEEVVEEEVKKAPTSKKTATKTGRKGSKKNKK